MLAEKLLANQVTDNAKIKEIISFLCSDSGRHDYTINRREAKSNLGLNVKTPDEEQYGIIKAIYDDINNELGFSVPFDPASFAQQNGGRFSVPRALIESIEGGSDSFVTEGIVNLVKVQGMPNQPDQEATQIVKQFEGWRHEEPGT